MLKGRSPSTMIIKTVIFLCVWPSVVLLWRYWHSLHKGPMAVMVSNACKTELENGYSMAHGSSGKELRRSFDSPSWAQDNQCHIDDNIIWDPKLQIPSYTRKMTNPQDLWIVNISALSYQALEKINSDL